MKISSISLYLSEEKRMSEQSSFGEFLFVFRKNSFQTASSDHTKPKSEPVHLKIRLCFALKRCEPKRMAERLIEPTTKSTGVI